MQVCAIDVDLHKSVNPPKSVHVPVCVLVCLHECALSQGLLGVDCTGRKEDQRHLPPCSRVGRCSGWSMQGAPEPGGKARSVLD